ncbi:tsr1, partial [Symbiodinium microadriaticum]
EKKPTKRTQSKGRVETTRSSVKKINTAAISKQDRLNTLKQLRESKKEEIWQKKRLGVDFGERPLPPKVVCLVGFHTQADPLSLKRKILALCGHSAEEVAALPPHVPVTAALPNWAQGPGMGRQRVLLIDPPRHVFGVMDAAKCADVVLCVLGPHASLEEPAFDDLGYKTLTALKAQGLPLVFGAIHGSDTTMATTTRKQNEARKFVTRYFHTELGAETKLFPATTDEE